MGLGAVEGATHPEALLLLHGGVDADGGEVALREQFVQLLCPQHALHEDHDLRQQNSGQCVLCRDERRSSGKVCEGDRLHIPSSDDDEGAAAEVFSNFASLPLLPRMQVLAPLHGLAAPRQLQGRLIQMAAWCSHEPAALGHYQGFYKHLGNPEYREIVSCAHLVEVQSVQEVVQLPVLFFLLPHTPSQTTVATARALQALDKIKMRSTGLLRPTDTGHAYFTHGTSPPHSRSPPAAVHAAANTFFEAWRLSMQAAPPQHAPQFGISATCLSVLSSSTQSNEVGS